MSITKIICLLGCFFIVQTLSAQVTNINVTVTQVSSNIGDCDGVWNDSDPAFWWNDAPNGIDIDNQCVDFPGNNGGTFNVNENLYNGPWVCDLSFEFMGCEDDGPTGCIAGEALTIICDGAFGSTVVDLNNLLGASPMPTSGNYNIGPICVTSNCGPGGDNYCFNATVSITQNTPPADLIVNGSGDQICEAIPLSVQSSTNDDNGYFKWCEDMSTETNESTSTSGSAQGSAWFSFTAPSSGNVFINTYDNSYLGGSGCFLACGTEFAVYHAVNGTGCTDGINACTGAVIKDKFDYLAQVDNADLGGPANATFYADLELSCNGIGGDGLIPGEEYYIQASVDDPNTTGVLWMQVTNDGGSANANAHDVPCGAIDIDGLLTATPITNEGLVAGTIDGEGNINCTLNNGHVSNIALIDQSCTHDWEVDEDNSGGTPPYVYDESLGGGNDPDGSSWIRFTAPNSGEMFLETNICSQGEAIALYRPDPAFAPATPNDMSCANLSIQDYTNEVDGGQAFGGTTAIIQPNCLEPGYEYYAMLDPTTISVFADIAIWAFDPVAANLSPNPDAAPLNDIMCLALSNSSFEIPVNAAGNCGANDLTGNTTNACIETLAGEPNIGISQSTWHYFTVPPSGTIEINVTGGSIGQANFAIYETSDGTASGCYGGLASGGGATFTDAGACTLTPCLTGNSNAPEIKCCLTPNEVLAVQIDGASNSGSYTIEINEIDPDAGNITYIDPDGDAVTSSTANPTSDGPAIFCDGQSFTPTTDAVQCPSSSYCAAEASCEYPSCLMPGFVLHNNPNPSSPNAVTIYATDAPGGGSGFTNDGSFPTCQVIYVSPVVDATPFGDYCSSADIADPAPVVFLIPLSVAAAATVDEKCNVTFEVDGGLPCFDSSSEYTFELFESNGTTTTGVTGTTVSGVGMLTTPDASNYVVSVTDAEGCSITLPVNATACSPCSTTPGFIQN